MLVNELKEQVAQSAYVVDCGAVADALLRVRRGARTR